MPFKDHIEPDNRFLNNLSIQAKFLYSPCKKGQNIHFMLILILFFSDYINERNMKFNQKLERFYGKYTKEIKDNLERGTAV